MKYPIRLALVIIALVTSTDLGFAQRRGGGGRGGGMRGGGGGMRGGSFQSRGAARPSINRRPSSGGNFNRGGNINRGNINRGNINSGNINRGNINRGNINRGNINTGDFNRNNINVDRDYGVNVDGDRYRWNDGCCYRPLAGAAVVAGATAAALAVGSTTYVLPAGCSTVYVDGISYENCGGTWYQPQFVGTTTEYVVVEDPDDD